MKINIIGLSIRWRPSPKFKFAPNLFGLFNAYIRKLGIVGPFGPKITGGLPMPQQALPGFLSRILWCNQEVMKFIQKII
jgi:hypothetical protein